MKNKFISDDDLPLRKMLQLHNMVIVYEYGNIMSFLVYE